MARLMERVLPYSYCRSQSDASPCDVNSYSRLTLQIFGFCAQTLLTLGLQRETAGRAGLAMYLSVSPQPVLCSKLIPSGRFRPHSRVPRLANYPGILELRRYLHRPLVRRLGRCTSYSALRSPTDVWQIGDKGMPAASDDVESRPISRSPSPIAPPSSGRPTLRGEHYSYETVPLREDDDLNDDVEVRPLQGRPANGQRSNGRLDVSRRGIGRRRSSGRSSISGFTSDAVSD